MVLDQKTLQKKRDKKDKKRKEVKKTGFFSLFGFARDWAMAERCEIADVYVPDGIFEAGIGNVFFSRRMSDGRYALSIFLVDTTCLGVKNALYKIMESHEYQEFLSNYLSSTEETYKHQHPTYARKLVESALKYASSLGLDPHSDYKIAKHIFGDVDPQACPVSFTFGRNGKPFYCCGPNDSPTFQRRTIKQLEKHCGKDGYHLVVNMDVMDPLE